MSRKTKHGSILVFAEHPYAYRYVSVKRWACRTLRFWGETESSHPKIMRIIMACVDEQYPDARWVRKSPNPKMFRQRMVGTGKACKWDGNDIRILVPCRLDTNCITICSRYCIVGFPMHITHVYVYV